MTRLHLLAPLAALLLIAACESEGTTGGPDPTPPEDDTSVTTNPVGTVPPYQGQGSVEGAGIRRMTLRELDASITVAAGIDQDGEPIFWNALAGVKISALDNRAYGPILGVPDFVAVTGEDPAPSPLYVKFMQDMSRDVCSQMVLADASLTPNDEKTLWRYAPVDSEATAEQVEENIRYLLLRFLGLEGEEAAPRCDALAELYETIKAANDQATAWALVCIALLEDPAFHLH